MADEEEEGKQILQKLQELVNQLYSFRDCYFDTHSVEDAGRKQQDVREEMEKTLQQIKEVVGSVQGKAQVLMLTGKALNVTPDYSPKAEELLSKAVKLEPKLVEAWNQLGEVYWKKGDVAAAHTCFSGALTHCKNKVSLQNLSMVLRQLRTDSGDEHSRHVMDSVRQAKLAVQMDVHDGRSWYILGNAYLSLYFNTGQNPKISQQALSAYAQDTFGLVDSDGPCCAVMVYNMVQSWGVLIRDSVAIPEPSLRLHGIQHKGKDYSFSSVRVETPLLLVVNGKPQGSSSQAAATVASRPQCE
ncbi:LOW QUALITY PROTEIN: tetratricopeptide repeat protein 5-like [Eptesicus fuscus]|uniref:LOW QUALITY PROTEIN: tetratricopeptide repeat protein 5-like n=1 Tax=Eptesicus fuscus TaxID=29078 RepID=UPI00240445C9|nr:LOW QUALITY PROTEIN: tetratricopeptide repeat protein 5-like [Eptesicus fuscus]